MCTCVCVCLCIGVCVTCVVVCVQVRSQQEIDFTFKLKAVQQRLEQEEEEHNAAKTRLADHSKLNQSIEEAKSEVLRGREKKNTAFGVVLKSCWSKSFTNRSMIYPKMFYI